MTFLNFYKSLTAKEKEAFAKRAGTTRSYIDTHLMAARKIPRKPSLEKLAKASHGRVSRSDLIAHFYGPEWLQAA